MKNSCRTLLIQLALTTLLLGREGLRDFRAGAIPITDLAYVLMGEPETPSYGGANTSERIRLLKRDVQGRKIHGGNQLSVKGHYAEPRMPVNQKTRLRVSVDLRPQIADALRAARKSLSFTQTQLAELLGASQGAITRWERAIDSPPISAITAIAKMVPDEQRAFWLEAAGIVAGPEPDVPNLRSIPVLRDAAAAGTPRAISDAAVDFVLALPTQLVSRGGKLVGVKVEGDSMSPILESGYIALIDTASRRAESLVGKMVAARDGDGVTIKWLRKQGKDLYLLVPQHTSPRHQIQIMQPEGEWSIVGEVVKWIGEPPSPAKRK